MTRHALLATLLVVVTTGSTAQAEDRTWEAILVGSATVTLVGGGLYLYGADQVGDAELALCTGEYSVSCGHPPPDNRVDIERLNDKGERGSDIASVGAWMMLGGAVLTAVATYKVVTKPKAEKKLVVAPTLTRDGAGATVQLRW